MLLVLSLAGGSGCALREEGHTGDLFWVPGSVSQGQWHCHSCQGTQVTCSGCQVLCPRDSVPVTAVTSPQLLPSPLAPPWLNALREQWLCLQPALGPACLCLPQGWCSTSVKHQFRRHTAVLVPWELWDRGGEALLAGGVPSGPCTVPTM